MSKLAPFFYWFFMAAWSVNAGFIVHHWLFKKGRAPLTLFTSLWICLTGAMLVDFFFLF